MSVLLGSCKEVREVFEETQLQQNSEFDLTTSMATILALLEAQVKLLLVLNAPGKEQTDSARAESSFLDQRPTTLTPYRGGWVRG